MDSFRVYSDRLKAGMRECESVGTAHATKDGLRAMYADLVVFTHGTFRPRHATVNIFAHLCLFDSDEAIADRAATMMRDHGEAVLVACADPDAPEWQGYVSGLLKGQ